MFERVDVEGNGTISWRELNNSLDMINNWGYDIDKNEVVNVFKVINTDNSDNVIT